VGQTITAWGAALSVRQIGSLHPHIVQQPARATTNKRTVASCSRRQCGACAEDKPIQIVHFTRQFATLKSIGQFDALFQVPDARQRDLA